MIVTVPNAHTLHSLLFGSHSNRCFERNGEEKKWVIEIKLRFRNQSSGFVVCGGGGRWWIWLINIICTDLSRAPPNQFTHLGKSLLVSRCSKNFEATAFLFRFSLESVIHVRLCKYVVTTMDDCFCFHYARAAQSSETLCNKRNDWKW